MSVQVRIVCKDTEAVAMMMESEDSELGLEDRVHN